MLTGSVFLHQTFIFHQTQFFHFAQIMNTTLIISKVQMTQYDMYFGQDDDRLLADFISTGHENILARLCPMSMGPNRIELFLADDDSMAIFKFQQPIPDSLELHTTWLIKSDAAICQALRNLMNRGQSEQGTSERGTGTVQA